MIASFGFYAREWISRLNVTSHLWNTSATEIGGSDGTTYPANEINSWLRWACDCRMVADVRRKRFTQVLAPILDVADDVFNAPSKLTNISHVFSHPSCQPEHIGRRISTNAIWWVLSSLFFSRKDVLVKGSIPPSSPSSDQDPSIPLSRPRTALRMCLYLQHAIWSHPWRVVRLDRYSWLLITMAAMIQSSTI